MPRPLSLKGVKRAWALETSCSAGALEAPHLAIRKVNKRTERTIHPPFFLSINTTVSIILSQCTHKAGALQLAEKGTRDKPLISFLTYEETDRA